MKTGFANRLFLAVLSFAMAATIRADVSATVTSVRQNWPWDTRVKVEYEVSGGVCDVTPLLVFGGEDSAIRIPQSKTLSYSTGAEYSLRGDLCAVGPGTHVLEFDAAAIAFPTNVSRPVAMKGLSVSLEVKETSLRKYLVIDLSSMPYAISWLDAVPDGGWTDEYKTSKMVLARIPVYGETTFEVGAPTNEFGFVEKYEKPGRFASLTNDYYMCIFEVTQKQWQNVMGTVPSGITANNVADTKPVTKVSWRDFMGDPLDSGGCHWPVTSAVSSDCFVGRLRANTTLPPSFTAGYKFNLPTQVQWEFACRGGVMSTWYDGSDISVSIDETRNGNARPYDTNLERLAWYAHNSSGRLHPVGGKLPNAYGLYDMLGNATEWNADYALADNLPVGTEPVGERSWSASTAPNRALRGGNYSSYAFAVLTTYKEYGQINASQGDQDYGILTQRPAFHVRMSWGDKHDFISARIALAYTRVAEIVAGQ